MKFHSLTTKDGAAYPVHRSVKFLFPLWPLKKDHCSLVDVMLKSSRDFFGDFKMGLRNFTNTLDDQTSKPKNYRGLRASKVAFEPDFLSMK